MIDVHQLEKHFGSITAVDGVSFRVDRGEVLGFLGPNGAGKSTTMRMIIGYLTPDRGRITVGQVEVARDPIAARVMIGYLPENAPLYDEMTVLAFLKFVAGIRGLTRAPARAAIDRVVGLCRLQGVRHQPIGTLSKGYRRRTSFAQALLHDPPVLILDEPTDGLDPNQKHEVRTLIRDMGREKAIIISTHILEEVDAACSRVLILDRGRLIFDGTPEALRARGPQKTARVQAVIQGPAADGLQQALDALDAVAGAELAAVGDRIRCALTPRGAPADVTQALCRLCLEHDWQLHTLSSGDERLDEVFRHLTTGTEGGTAS